MERKKSKTSRTPKIVNSVPTPKKPKKRFHCSVQQCDYSTLVFKDLARHMRKHTGTKINKHYQNKC